MADKETSDRYVFVFAALAMTMMIGNLIAGKTARDAFFLSNFDVTDLPKMMIATALLSALAVVAFSRLLTRYGPARLIPPVYLVSGLGFIAEWIAMGWMPLTITVVLYLHATVLTSLLISGYWSIINERYDPYSAKKIVSRLVIFNAVGTIFGGAAANGVAELIDSRAIIAMLALLHMAVALALYQVIRGQPIQRRQQAKSVNLLSVFKQNTLIRRMALLVLALASVVALLDYLLKSALQTTLPNEDLVTFFSYFYMGIGIGSFMLQTLVGHKALRWLGLGGTMAVLPLTAIFGGLITLAFRNLVTITLLRASTNLLSNTLFKSGFELLFTPISPADKRASKVLIDVGADRSGEMLGSLLIMGLLLIPGPTDDYLLFNAMLLAGAMLLLIFLLHRGYVSQLANNLCSGTLKLDQIEIKDATTERTVALTRTSLERDKLLKQIAQSRETTDVTAAPPDTTAPAVPASESSPAFVEEDPEVDAIRELRCQDEKRIRRVLLNKPITPALLPHVLVLLRDQKVLREALNAAKPLASIATGQMTDYLLDRHQHPLIRRRIPLLLGQADNARSVLGLTLGLQDAELDVRFRCAGALGRIKTNHPHLPVDTETLWRVIHQEIGRLRGADTLSKHGVEPLRHLFNLLGVILGPDVMGICYDSLQSEDPRLRGTALEYLDNQLPQDVRTTLWPLIASGPAAPKSDRSAQEILRDLRNAVPFLKRTKPNIEET